MLQLRRRKKYSQQTIGLIQGNNEKQKALFIGRNILNLMKNVQDFIQDKKLDPGSMRFVVGDEPIIDSEGKEGRRIVVGYIIESREKEWRRFRPRKPERAAEEK